MPLAGARYRGHDIVPRTREPAPRNGTHRQSHGSGVLVKRNAFLFAEKTSGLAEVPPPAFDDGLLLYNVPSDRWGN